MAAFSARLPCRRIFSASCMSSPCNRTTTKMAAMASTLPLPPFSLLFYSLRYSLYYPVQNTLYCASISNMPPPETRKRSRGVTEPATSTPSTIDDCHPLIDTLTKDLTTTKTKAGWCLKEGLNHIARVDQGRMISLVQQHGLPTMYSNVQQDDDKASPKNCFQSLCRIVAGQFFDILVLCRIFRHSDQIEL